jgi:hypothetical protein
VAKFTLTIETDDAYELANLTAALADEAGEVAAPADRPTPAADKPKRGRPSKASASAVEQTGVVESPVEKPAQPSPSTTASPFDLNVKQGAAAVEAIKDPGAAKLTLADAKSALNDLISATDTGRALEVMKAMGFERISACPEDKYGAFIAKVQEILGK